MPSLSDFLIGFLDSLTGHLALTVYLLAVTDERAVWRRLKRLPFLFLSPLVSILLSIGLYDAPKWGINPYYISSFAILLMISFWVRWAWRWEFWRAFASVCMASIFQVAVTTLTSMIPVEFAVAIGLHLGVSIAVSLLLYKLRFGTWFRVLLDNDPVPWRTALLLFALEAVMEVLLRMGNGVQPRFLMFYYLLVAVMVVLMTVLVVYMAQQIDTTRKMQAQQDIIAQQQLYEQDLEMIRREVRAFRHDYKNLLAGLSQQAGAGELEGLRHTLSELDAGFDLRIGEKIQSSAQIGNVQIPEVRSLLLSKLTVMREKGAECHLEVIYPVVAVDMDVWDFVRCLGILIDNAVEAALDMKQPWVEIVLLAQHGQVVLRVSNSYANIIEPGKMWDEGWSTKGTGRGLGLSSYQRILENYSNASTRTRWENGVFVQEMTVEGTGHDRN
ncbi:MAG: GHKL domain-containing protein [Lachnospiraceae bacterium]|jgi:two-component system sensor histidine kinase AgrC|nr:GHKL domain-containing protein [Lachnospiraceae bacterium]